MNKLYKLGLLALTTFVTGCRSSVEPTSSITEAKLVSVWGEEYGEAIIGSLGVDLPYIENQGFKVQTSTDDYGDPLVIIFVYEYEGKDSLQLFEDYASICADSGYAVTLGTGYGMDENYVSYSYPIYYADGWINDVDAVEIQIVEGVDPENGKAALGIFAFNYIHYDETAWPTACVEKLLGHDVPSYYVEDYGLTYYAEFEVYGGMQDLYIQIKGGWEDCETEYYQILEEAGYVIDDSYYEDGEGYYAYPLSPTDHVIQFGFSYGYGLEIFIYQYEFSWKDM